MADMGYGLSRDDIMRVAFQIVEKTKKPHPFANGAAGKSWLQDFLSRHKLSIRSPQPLSHARAQSVTDDVIKDFFEKLGGIFARLNLLSKPMQIYNIDETSINVVHKPGKVAADIKHKKVWSITSAERGKTHTVLTCVNASGQSIPPLMIFPRKRMKEDLKEGAIPGTMFRCSESGWINQQLFLEWFEFFIESIPPARPVLIIEDGHASHVSLDVIKLAKESNIHLLCLPSHSTHILQPVDVGVFKSLKAHFNKECRDFLHSNPGIKIRSENLASLLSLAWPKALTPMNVMKGFKQCGIFPLNPGVISDRLLAPSKVFSPEPSEISDCDKTPEIANISDFSDILSLPKVPSVSNKQKERKKKRKERKKKRKERKKKRKERKKKRKERKKKRKERKKKRKERKKRRKERKKRNDRIKKREKGKPKRRKRFKKNVSNLGKKKRERKQKLRGTRREKEKNDKDKKILNKRRRKRKEKKKERGKKN
uniref:HTH CENPB-type domain-containing protein n=1 Tax=Amphimedon queenslandica TaxID=400682 RepID=A0A1X7TXI8_AMPQE